MLSWENFRIIIDQKVAETKAYKNWSTSEKLTLMDLSLWVELIHLQNWPNTYSSKPKPWSKQALNPS